MKTKEAIEALQKYKDKGIKPGSFLTAVLENNLQNAVLKADDESKGALVNIVQYCWDTLPANIWGSPTAVEDHLNKTRGYTGLAQPPSNIDIEGVS
jgi:hypothetical protein